MLCILHRVTTCAPRTPLKPQIVHWRIELSVKGSYDGSPLHFHSFQKKIILIHTHSFCRKNQTLHNELIRSACTERVHGNGLRGTSPKQQCASSQAIHQLCAQNLQASKASATKDRAVHLWWIWTTGSVVCSPVRISSWRAETRTLATHILGWVSKRGTWINMGKELTKSK